MLAIVLVAMDHNEAAALAASDKNVEGAGGELILVPRSDSPSGIVDVPEGVEPSGRAQPCR